MNSLDCLQRHLRMIKSKLIKRKHKKLWVNVKVVRVTTWIKVEIMKQLHRPTGSKKLENCNSRIRCRINHSLHSTFWIQTSMLNKCKIFELWSKIKKLIKMWVELQSAVTTIPEKTLEKLLQQAESMVETKAKMLLDKVQRSQWMWWPKVNLNTITIVQPRLEMTVYIKIKTKQWRLWPNNQARATP